MSALGAFRIKSFCEILNSIKCELFYLFKEMMKIFFACNILCWLLNWTATVQWMHIAEVYLRHSKMWQMNRKYPVSVSISSSLMFSVNSKTNDWTLLHIPAASYDACSKFAKAIISKLLNIFNFHFIISIEYLFDLLNVHLFHLMKVNFIWKWKFSAFQLIYVDFEGHIT